MYDSINLLMGKGKNARIFINHAIVSHKNSTANQLKVTKLANTTINVTILDSQYSQGRKCMKASRHAKSFIH